MEQEITRCFNEMRSTLTGKSQWHREKTNLYEGKHTADSLNISLPREFDRKLKTELDWGAVAVDTLAADLDFDGFRNDSLGFTRLLYDYNGYPAIKSAIKNSMIGACSFIAVLPREDGSPFFTSYTGAEATGIYDSRDGLVQALAVNSYEDTNGFRAVKDWLYFLPGHVLKIDNNGRILSVVEMPTSKMLLVPFFYNQDAASRPFGCSRISAAAVNALESALRTLKLIEIGHDVRLAIRNVILASGAPGDLQKSETKVDLQSILTIFNEGAGNVSIESLTGPSTSELQSMMALLATNFASAVRMSATDFGYQPANGSLGEAAIEDQKRAYVNLVKSQRAAYGESITELAHVAMSLATGQEANSDWNTIMPHFNEQIADSKFGAMADGLGKVASIVPDLDLSDIVKYKLTGKTVLEEALTVELPDFQAAKNKALEFSSLRAAPHAL